MELEDPASGTFLRRVRRQTIFSEIGEKFHASSSLPGLSGDCSVGATEV